MQCSGDDRNAFRVTYDFRIPDFPFTPSFSGESVRPSSASPHSTKLSEQCVLSWFTTNRHDDSGCTATVRLQCSKKSSSVCLGPTVGAIDSPVTTWKLAIRHCVPWRMYSNSIRSFWPGRIFFWRNPLERLNAGHLINADRMRIKLSHQHRSGGVTVTHRANLLVKDVLVLLLGIEPIPRLVRLELRLSQ